MKTMTRSALIVALALAMVGLTTIASADETAAGASADPDALQILKRMTDFLGALKSFSMHTENSFEDVLDSGQKIQYDFASDVVIERPDKLRAERTDGDVDQTVVYDGGTIVVYDGSHDIYAEATAPDNLDDMLHFARDSLDLVPPAGDMVFSNAYQLLTSGLTSGFVVGKAVIDGVHCTQLAFTTPVVDWQIWIADGDKPLPVKYVLTTRDDPAQPQYIVLISNWNTDPLIPDGFFDFDIPPTASATEFVVIDADTGSGE